HIVRRVAQDSVDLLRCQPGVLLEHERSKTRDMRCRGRGTEKVRELVRRIVETWRDECTNRAIATISIIVIEARVKEEEGCIAAIGTGKARCLAYICGGERNTVFVEIDWDFAGR